MKRIKNLPLYLLGIVFIVIYSGGFAGSLCPETVQEFFFNFLSIFGGIILTLALIGFLMWVVARTLVYNDKWNNKIGDK